MGKELIDLLFNPPSRQPGPAVRDPDSAGAEQWNEYVDSLAEAYPNVPSAVVKSIIVQESSGNPAATGVPTKHGRARGLGQFIDKTAKQYIPEWRSPKDSYDPQKNIQGIYAYMNDLIQEHGSVKGALDRYFGIGTDPTGQTNENYSKEVMARAGILPDVMKGNFIFNVLFGGPSLGGQKSEETAPKSESEPETIVQAPKSGMESAPLDFESRYAIPFQGTDPATTATPGVDPNEIEKQMYNPGNVALRKEIGGPQSGEVRKPTGGREIPMQDSPIGALVGETVHALNPLNEPDALTTERMKDFPVETMAGQITGTVAPSFLTGAALQGSLLKIPAMAKLAGAGKWGKTAFQAIVRGTTTGTNSAIRSRDDLTSENPEIRKKAIGQLATGIVASVVSPSVENFLPKGGMQMLYQSVLDMGIQMTGDALIGEKPLDPENLVNTIAGGVMSALFAMNDIKRVPEIIIGKVDPDVRAESVKPEPEAPKPETDEDILSGAFQKANEEAPIRNNAQILGLPPKGQEQIPYKSQRRTEAQEKMGTAAEGQGSGEKLYQEGLREVGDIINNYGTETIQYKPEFENLAVPDKREALSNARREVKARLKQENVNATMRSDLDNLDRLLEKDLRRLGKSDEWKKVKGETVTRRQKAGAERYIEAGETQSIQWDTFAEDVSETLKNLTADDLSWNLAKKYGDMFDDAEIETARQQIINDEAGGEMAKNIRRYFAEDVSAIGYEDPGKIAEMIRGTDFSENPIFDEPETKFSSETGDVFKRTDFEDTRTSGQKEFDQASQAQQEARRAKQKADPFKGTDFDPEVQEAKTTRQEDMFGGGSYYASSGEYAKRQKKPSGIQLPEIVELAKGLMQGKYPKVVKKFRNAGVLGRFLPRGKESKIELRADIFQDMEQAEKTLAHEIGHADDYFPEMTMSRGNIIGRIASFKKFGKEYLAGFPGGPEPLTDKEKNRLRKLAKQMLSPGFEKEIDEEIVKITKFTPEDIKAVWNSIDQSKIDPKLSDFIKGLSTAEKKSIVLEAMKGRVPESVPVKEERIKTGNKIKVTADGGEATPEAIAKKYQQLFEDEIKKRELLVASKVRKELIDLGVIWKPFDPTKKDSYTKYRLKGEELFADAVSVLINEPDLLAEKAPMFYRGLFSYMENKPEMKKVYEGIQAKIEGGTDEVLAKREERVLKGFEEQAKQKKSEYEDRINKQRREGAARGLYRAGLEKYAVLEEAEAALKKAGIEITDDKSPFLLARSKPYVMGKIQAYTGEAKRRVKGALGWGKEEKDLLGLFMFARRAAGERAKMANPEGVGGEYAEEQLKYMKRKLGEEKFNQVQKAADEFSKLRQEDIIPYLTNDNTFSKALRDKIKNNQEYARFSVLKEFVKNYGKDAARSILGIKKQVGTLRAVGNPFIETVVNDAMLIRSKQRNDLIRASVEMLQKGKDVLPYRIEDATQKNIRGVKQFNHVENSEFKTVYYLKDGEIQAYNIDREIADLLVTDPVTGNGALRALRGIGNIQRALFVKLSPGFLARNPVRDIKGFARGVPEANLRQAVRYTLKAMPEVWDFVKTGKMSDDMRSALKEGAIPTERSYSKERALNADDEIERLMSQFGSEEAKKKFIGRQLGHINNFFEAIGQMEEKSVKLGGYKYISENMPNVSKERRAHLVRTRVGTPDVFSGGTAKPVLNNIFLFSNANLQGIRSAVEAYKEDKGRFLKKAMLYDVAPKALVIAAEVGLLTHLADRFGLAQEEAEWIEDAYKAIPDYHKARGDVIPLPFRYEDGRQPYLMIPQDYTGQALGAIWYRTLKAMAEKDAGQIPKIAAEVTDMNPISQAGLQPVLELGSTWWEYANGKNPIDAWSNREVIPDQKYGAGLDKELPEMLKWSYDQVGGSIIYKIPNSYNVREKGNLEKMLGVPFAGAVPSAFIKVSDKGIRDRQAKEQKKVEKQEKRVRLDLRDDITESLKGVNVPNEDNFRKFFSSYRDEQRAAGNKVNRAAIRKTWQSVVSQKYGSGELKKIYSAPTIAQREALVEQYLNKNKYIGEERKKMRRKLMVKEKVFKEMIQ